MMYDKPSPRSQSPLFSPNNFPLEIVSMKGDEEINSIVELNVLLQIGNQTETGRTIGLDNLVVGAEQMAFVSQTETRISLPIPPSFVWPKLLLQMYQSM